MELLILYFKLHMKKLILPSIMSISLGMNAQQVFPTLPNSQKGVDYHVELNEALIVDKRTFSSDTARYNYNQMRHYVKMIMPYVNVAVKMFSEIETNTAGMNRKNRRKYIKTREEEIKVNFEDQLKNLNVTQGRYLVKIINRQLNRNCYDIVKELKNPITAAYYQSWAKLNGINLNEKYVADENRDLEMVLRNLGY